MEEKMTKEQEIKQLNKQYSLFSYIHQNAADPDVYEEGDGIYIYDTEGKKYVDLASSYVNVNIGFGHEEIVNVAEEQMKKLHYCKPIDATEIRGKLCEKIITEVAPPNMAKIFLTLGGSDANDSAVRIAKAVTGKRKILSQYHAYHGATIGAANLCGDYERIYEKIEHPDYIHFFGYNSKNFRKYFSDEDKYCDFLLDLLEEKILLEDPNMIAAIFYETISLGNIVMPAKRYYEGVRKLCDKYGILLIFDEVLVGFGRTGKWFACEHYNVWPDIMTFAKGVTSSYMPLGGVMVSKEVSSKLDQIPLTVALTCSFHPVSCAVGYAVINYMQREHVVENAEKMGAYLKSQLEQNILPHPYVEEVRGIGMLQSIVFSGSMDCRSAALAFCELLKEKGYITWVDRTAVLIAPTLIIAKDEIDKLVRSLGEILENLKGKNYIERLEYYPEEGGDGASSFYSIAYMEAMSEMVSRLDNILILGSANLVMLRIILASLHFSRKNYTLYLSENMQDKIKENEKAHSIFFEGDRFTVNRQSAQIKEMKKEKYDAVLMPYGRDDEDWENIYEVAGEFGVPVYLIRNNGTVKEIQRS